MFSREEKFDRIDSQLRRLEHIVQSNLDFNDGRESRKPTTRLSSPSNADTRGPEHTPGSVEMIPDDSMYRGDSSFEVHSGATRQVLGEAITDPESLKAGRRSLTSVNALQSFVHANKPCNHSHFEHDLSMPSRDLVLKAAKLAKRTYRQMKLNRHTLIQM